MIEIAKNNLIFHPFILKSDGRSRIKAIINMNAPNIICWRLWADLNFDSHNSSQKFSSALTALPQTTQCLWGANSAIRPPVLRYRERVNKVLHWIIWLDLKQYELPHGCSYILAKGWSPGLILWKLEETPGIKKLVVYTFLQKWTFFPLNGGLSSKRCCFTFAKLQNDVDIIRYFQLKSSFGSQSRNLDSIFQWK